MRVKKIAVMMAMGILSVAAASQAVAQERRDADLKEELFLSEYDDYYSLEEDGDFLPQEYGEEGDFVVLPSDLTQEDLQRMVKEGELQLPSGMTVEDLVGAEIAGEDGMPLGMTEEYFKPATQSDIKLMLPRLAQDLESQLFKKNNIFWPTWDLSKEQILLVSQYYDFAILLNNQDADVDTIGARIEYSARTFDDVFIKVSPFGLTKINGIDTYYYNIDMTHMPGIGDFQGVYEQHLRTAIHEAVHVLAQTGDVKTADLIAAGSAMRGVTYPIDIESRHFRNEVFYRLKTALMAQNKQDKAQAVRQALYFHQAYLAVKPDNKGHDDYDYAEGMADYIHTAAINLIKNPDLKREELIDISAQSLLDGPIFSAYDNSPGSRVIEWGREYYTLGSIAYAVALQLGHDDIYASTSSPFTFLSGKYDPLEAPVDAQVKKDVYAHYGGIEQKILAQKEEINRFVSHKDNILLKIETKFGEQEGLIILNDNILLEHDGQPVSFEIREQEIRFGDHRIKITQKALLSLSLTGGFSEDDVEDHFTGYGDSEGYDENHVDDISDGFLIIPVHKDDVELSDGKVTVQTESLVLFDIKYKKEGKYLVLLRG